LKKQPFLGQIRGRKPWNPGQCDGLHRNAASISFDLGKDIHFFGPLSHVFVSFSRDSALLLLNFGLLLVTFGLLLVTFGLLLVTFGLLLVNFGLLLTNFGLLLINFGLLLTNFGLLLRNFALLLRDYAVFSFVSSPWQIKYYACL